MSATLRHDIGQAIAEALEREGGGVMFALAARPAERWAGVHRPRTKVVTFAAKLPRDVATVYDLIRVCWEVFDKYDNRTVRNGAHLLRKKLTVSLGLPWGESDGLSADELAFLAAINGSPGDIAAWSAYADWMTERDNLRGRLIEGWLGPKAIKVRYGVPEMARKALGLHSNEDDD